MDKNKIISKSKYIAGLQCLKYLWYLINDPETIPPFDEVTQFRFQQGHDVGNLAKSLFPGGIEIEHGVDIEAELARARELTNLTNPAAEQAAATANNNISTGNTGSASSSSTVSTRTGDTNTNTNTVSTSTSGTGTGDHTIRHPLFEPAFIYKNAFARADILEPSGTDAWNIIEVKSASSIKDINKHDISFQKYCYEGAGLKINKCYLMYLNRDFIKDGPIDPHKFFAIDDVTAEAEILKEGVEEKINLMLEAINSGLCPEINIGKNCFNPYDCPLKEVCWSRLPKNNIFELYKGREAACYFYRNGIIEISQINETSMLSSIQLMQYRAVKENCEIIDKDRIGQFMKKLKYPLYFLDFETFATAIPLFDGLKPYQNIPFQFSCHLMQFPDAKPESLYFLAGDDKTDPRVGFLESLEKALGYDSAQREDKQHSTSTAGSILVYYEPFEKNILKELARVFPEHGWWIEDAIDRIIDLYEPFGKFYYYSSDQKGSASLKNVLPALTGKSYDDLEIQNGQMASLKYLNITFLKGETEPDRAHVEKIRKDLLDYCGLDTEGMIYILKELCKIAE
ncbi:MAG: DUF2779 domain-containing protein [Actinobacteria bacterium]|nr:DUF2779 domain-containing protein [Actinomycetota bacterium]